MREQKFEAEKDNHVGFEASEHEQWVKETQKKLRKLVAEINDVLEAIKEEEVQFLLKE